jgi:glycine cleavage system H protein
LEAKLNVPVSLKYHKTDEWVKVEANIATIGITDYAQEQLSDVVFAEIQVSVGDILERDKIIATVESVKASADVTIPLSGRVIKINNQINATPEILNSDPYGQAWLIQVEISQPGELNDLMDSKSYLEFRNA